MVWGYFKADRIEEVLDRIFLHLLEGEETHMRIRRISRREYEECINHAKSIESTERLSNDIVCIEYKGFYYRITA